MGGGVGAPPHLNPLGFVRIKARFLAEGEKPRWRVSAKKHRPRVIAGGVYSGARARIPIEYRAKKPADFFAMIQGFCATHTLAVCESKAKRALGFAESTKLRRLSDQ